jgi:hypothetical protein
VIDAAEARHLAVDSLQPVTSRIPSFRSETLLTAPARPRQPTTEVANPGIAATGDPAAPNG